MVIPCLHDQANIEQTSSKRRASFKLAGQASLSSQLDRVNEVLGGQTCDQKLIGFDSGHVAVIQLLWASCSHVSHAFATKQYNYLCQGGNVFARLCLSVCLLAR